MTTWGIIQLPTKTKVCCVFQIAVLCIVTACSGAAGYQCFGGPYCLYLQIFRLVTIFLRKEHWSYWIWKRILISVRFVIYTVDTVQFSTQYWYRPMHFLCLSSSLHTLQEVKPFASVSLSLSRSACYNSETTARICKRNCILIYTENCPASWISVRIGQTQSNLTVFWKLERLKKFEQYKIYTSLRSTTFIRNIDMVYIYHNI